MRLRRTVLMTPGDNSELIAKAAKSAADVVWLDLEDGVHDSRKLLARESIAAALRDLDWQAKERIVRVNPMPSELGQDDVRLMAATRPDAILLTKVEDPADVEAADRIITEVEGGRSANGVPIWCMIESPRGVVNVERIAAAGPRVAGLVFGGGGLLTELGVNRRTRSRLPELEGLSFDLLYARSRTVIAARAFGLIAIDSTFQDSRDQEGAYRDALYTFQLGFDGKLVSSPRQIEAVHRAHAPRAEDVDWARRTVSAFEQANREGRSVTVVDGASAVEGPTLESARQILERVRAIEERVG